ncbi:GNAT family N-acetyltransferase [Halobacteriales archaeon Cl-PHB]
MAVEVRPADRYDVPALRRISRAACETAHQPIVGEAAVEAFLVDHYATDDFQRRLDQPDAVFAVADDGSPQGFGFATPDDDATDRYHLSMLYVAPDRWGEGIGGRLCTYVESAVEDRGGDRIRLGVMAENDRAVGFYDAAGYEYVEEFYDDRLDVTSYIYEKELPAQG